MRYMAVVAAAGMILCVADLAIANSAFNGAGENQTDAYGYYYIITGGKFPTGTIPNGARTSTSMGGTFRYITDDPAWGYPIDVWRKDGWFVENASFALTLKNGGALVYDNNGLEDGTYGTYYDALAAPGAATNANPKDQVTSEDKPGLYRGFSMSNNFDWVYAGYFLLETETTFDEIIGYFDETAGFNRNSPSIRYRMNIWSNVAGDLLPVNTGSFTGDVFSTDAVTGAFSTSDTGADRVFGPDYGGMTDDIFRLTFVPDSPVTLPAGIYWFSHDATVVPEPLTVLGVLLGVGGVAGYLRRRRSL